MERVLTPVSPGISLESRDWLADEGEELVCPICFADVERFSEQGLVFVARPCMHRGGIRCDRTFAGFLTPNETDQTP